MTHALLLVALGVGTLGLRVSGLFFSHLRIPASLERVWRFVPLTLLAALITISLTGRTADETATRIIALAIAALVTYRFRQLWGCIASGMAAYYALRFML